LYEISAGELKPGSSTLRPALDPSHNDPIQRYESNPVHRVERGLVVNIDPAGEPMTNRAQAPAPETAKFAQISRNLKNLADTLRLPVPNYRVADFGKYQFRTRSEAEHTQPMNSECHEGDSRLWVYTNAPGFLRSWRRYSAVVVGEVEETAVRPTRHPSPT
jgi:hypothetical protein